MSQDSEAAAMRVRRGRGAAARDPERVTVRITRQGAGLVSTGEHRPFAGDATHPAGALLELGRDAAEALEARGLAEIQ
jgi:hypothetical protein